MVSVSAKVHKVLEVGVSQHQTWQSQHLHMRGRAIGWLCAVRCSWTIDAILSATPQTGQTLLRGELCCRHLIEPQKYTACVSCISNGDIQQKLTKYRVGSAAASAHVHKMHKSRIDQPAWICAPQLRPAHAHLARPVHGVVPKYINTTPLGVSQAVTTA